MASSPPVAVSFTPSPFDDYMLFSPADAGGLAAIGDMQLQDAAASPLPLALIGEEMGAASDADATMFDMDLSTGDGDYAMDLVWPGWLRASPGRVHLQQG